MMLGVVAALKTELAPALRALRTRARRHGARTIYEAPHLSFVVAGVGVEKAERAAAALQRHARLTALLSTGFAGALLDDLSPGDLVLGGSTTLAADAGLLRLARDLDPAARAADVVTVPAVLRDAAAKRRLAERSGAAVADMEAAAVATVARRHGLDFLCVKAVLDTPAAPLASSYAGVLSVLGETLRRPQTIAGIKADASRARKAAERLSEFYARLAEALAAPPERLADGGTRR